MLHKLFQVREIAQGAGASNAEALGIDSCTVQSLEQGAREMKEEIILEHVCVMGIKVAKGLPDRPTAWPSQGQWLGPPRGPCVHVCVGGWGGGQSS